jgi:hypothetical protein
MSTSLQAKADVKVVMNQTVKFTPMVNNEISKLMPKTITIPKNSHRRLQSAKAIKMVEAMPINQKRRSTTPLVEEMVLH